MSIPERDWKLFRELRELALDRFCKRVLVEVAALADSDLLSAHERYRNLYQLIHRRDKELAQLFDDPRRSNASIQLRLIYARGLFTADEVDRFSAETRSEMTRAGLGVP
ncbi:MAG: hypothetical protein JWQ90_2142 [Hydrocarboniphaga sp.]|uniref:hypothetical protein n=1 Tax=Hydrocarboniphaga sp. TaxID=2033016 RepID=UPI00261C3844|nr:hypothetical protein [Hydrocarboniphaga sp.]MDB5969692.1 hypothetical protein [Hydrocarboniphaga sp.]